MERKAGSSGWDDHPEPTAPTPDACLRTVHRSAASPSVEHDSQKPMIQPRPTQSPNPPSPTLGPKGRAVGLDVHPDSFAAAILAGRDPLHARVGHSVTRQPLDALVAWAARDTTAQDVLILEASANRSSVAERLQAIGRQIYIMESHRAEQIGKSYLASDKIEAGQAHLMIGGGTRFIRDGTQGAGRSAEPNASGVRRVRAPAHRGCSRRGYLQIRPAFDVHNPRGHD